MTIKELREYLSTIEKQWTDTDAHYLGAFEDQPISLPAYEDRGSGLRFVGYTDKTLIWYDNTGLGILMDVLDD